MEEFKATLNGKRPLQTNGSAFGSFGEPGKSFKRIIDPVPENLEIVKEKAEITKSSPCGFGNPAYECKRLLFRGEVYSVNDIVLIRETEKTNMIARIERILRENGDPVHPTWPMIEVTW